ncbi:hypothetical protein [Ottowia sp. SB7-C50]|uniref:hypothetical protein n=1 Tax=Ottowia sp. SB7-C50 TaxID=3081231 RepID=UPI002955058F|nr:hypothetical protein [Ottowia sp. SB7-C50]WOP14333.1 hypothetical protein R0D99_10620 [Ottowia sp. SB7-C50]
MNTTDKHTQPPEEPITAAPAGVPSQDPRLKAQEPLTPEERATEANSVAMGGGMMAGAAAGAALGAAIGGPVGVLVGGTAGAIAGALGGYAAVSAGDPNYDYWRTNYVGQPGYVEGYTYDDDYAPAYQLGYQGRQRYADRAWDRAEAELRTDWDKLKGKSRLTWDQAREATRAAWHRVEEALPGDADGDGR